MIEKVIYVTSSEILHLINMYFGSSMTIAKTNFPGFF